MRHAASYIFIGNWLTVTENGLTIVAKGKDLERFAPSGR